MIKSIIKNIGAHSLSTVINAVFQLLSVPLFLKYWGVDLYADWIVLTAITSYLNMSNLGLNTVTENEFVIQYTKGNLRLCNVLINNNFIFISAIFGLVFLITLVLSKLLDFSYLFRFTTFTEAEVEIGIIILIGQIYLKMVSGLFNSLFRAVHKYANEIMIKNLIRITEILFLFVGIIFGYSLITVLILYTLPKFLELILKYILSRRYFKVEFSMKYFDKEELKKIIKPALAYIVSPMADSIILQGFTLIVNYTLGGAPVVLFNTTRTIINLIKTGINLISNSVWPEVSIAYGKKDKKTLKTLHRWTVGISVYLSLILVLGLALFGKHIYMYWTDYKIDFDPLLFGIYLFTILTSIVWSSSRIILFATNNHEAYSYKYLLSSFAALAIAYLIAITTKQVSFIPLSLIFVDMVMSRVVLTKSLFITDDAFISFTRYSLREPILWIAKHVKRNSVN